MSVRFPLKVIFGLGVLEIMYLSFLLTNEELMTERKVWGGRDEARSKMCLKTSLGGALELRSLVHYTEDKQLYLTAPVDPDSSAFKYSVTEEFSHPMVCQNTTRYRLDETTPFSFNGGSSFFISKSTVSGFTFLCSSLDHFNGTYAITCPKVNGCFNLTISRRSAGFAAYSIYNRPESLAIKNVMVWTEQSCESMPDFALNHPPAWHLDNGTWKWHLGAQVGTFLPRFHKEDIRKCLSDYDVITIMGDSHLQFMADYIFSVLERDQSARMPEDVDEVQFQNVQFLWKRFTEESVSALENMLKYKKKHKQKTALVFMSGSWDIERISLFHFCRNSSIAMAKALQNLRQLNNWQDTKMIWVNNVAFPDRLTGGPWFRNSFVIHAGNACMRKALYSLSGLTEIDAFSMSFPRSEENVQTMHYFADTGKHTPFLGEVGRAILDRILYELCS